jgi:hypothetical protein
MSNSKLTLSPILRCCIFVNSHVYGIIATENCVSSLFATVRLIPFTVMDPCGTVTKLPLSSYLMVIK